MPRGIYDRSKMKKPAKKNKAKKLAFRKGKGPSRNELLRKGFRPSPKITAIPVPELDEQTILNNIARRLAQITVDFANGQSQAMGVLVNAHFPVGSLGILPERSNLYVHRALYHTLEVVEELNAPGAGNLPEELQSLHEALCLEADALHRAVSVYAERD